MAIMLTNERIAQMVALLEVMGKGSKMPSDGLGLYLGDGIPRKGLGELRTNELLEVLKEVQEGRKLWEDDKQSLFDNRS
jgi:hypothetical protein